jgi:hypothetical protein
MPALRHLPEELRNIKVNPTKSASLAYYMTISSTTPKKTKPKRRIEWLFSPG